MVAKKCSKQITTVQLYRVLFFTATFFIVEIIVSHVTHSLTLLLNAYHMLCNIVALVGCIVSLKYGRQEYCEDGRKENANGNCSIDVCKEKGSYHALPSDPKPLSPDTKMKNTFGWARIDILTMLVRGVFLASFCFTLLLEAALTLSHISHQDQMHLPMTVMGIGIIGIILNAFCYIMIGGYTLNQSLRLHTTKDGNVVLQRVVADEQEQLAPAGRRPIAIPKSRRLMDFIRDVFGCVLVVVASLLVQFTYKEDEGEPGKPSPDDISKYFDPAIAVVSAIFLIILSYPYLRESCMILLQTIPNHINIEALEKELLGTFPGIVNVHDFHVWHLAGTKVVSTVHITFLTPKVYATTKDQVTAFFVEMGITQVTIQPEFHKVRSSIAKTDCLIRCQGNLCLQSQCCNTQEVLHEIITSDCHLGHGTHNKRSPQQKVTQGPADVDLRQLTENKSDDEKNREQIHAKLGTQARPEVGAEIRIGTGGVLGAVGTESGVRTDSGPGTGTGTETETGTGSRVGQDQG